MRLGNELLPPPTDVPSYGYIRGLDGLRFAAVVIVVLAHYRLSAALPGGFGVTVFFAISGFLIARLLLAEEIKNGAISFPNFFARRFIRLMPPLVLMLVLTIPIYILMIPEQINIPQLVLAFLYLSNFYAVAEVFFDIPAGIHGYGLLWSLAVEEHFYLAFPFLLILCRSWGTRMKILVAVLVGSLLLRIAAFLTVPDPETFNYYFTFTRLDSITWGCFLTFALAKSETRDILVRLRGWKTVAVALVLLLGGIAYRNDFFQDTFRYTIHGIGMLLLINAFVFGRATEFFMRIAEWRLIQIGGRISYETYLWHLHVWFVIALMTENYWIRFGASLLVTLALSYIFYKLTTGLTRRIAKRFGGKSVEEERRNVYQAEETEEFSDSAAKPYGQTVTNSAV